jgi:hypothetical protein
MTWNEPDKQGQTRGTVIYCRYYTFDSGTREIMRFPGPRRTIIFADGRTAAAEAFGSCPVTGFWTWWAKAFSGEVSSPRSYPIEIPAPPKQ